MLNNKKKFDILDIKKLIMDSFKDLSLRQSSVTLYDTPYVENNRAFAATANVSFYSTIL